MAEWIEEQDNINDELAAVNKRIQGQFEESVETSKQYLKESKESERD